MVDVKDFIGKSKNELLVVAETLVNEISFLKSELEKFTLLMKELELKLKIEIDGEVDENGKKVYSNADKRELEYLNRIRKNEEYNKCNDTYIELWKKLKIYELYKDYIEGELKK